MICEKCGRKFDGVRCPLCGANGIEEPNMPSEVKADTPVKEAENISVNNEYTGAADDKKDLNYTLSLVSMISGIISIVLCFSGAISIALGALAVVTAVLSRKDKKLKGMGLAGFITGIVGVALGVFILICIILWLTVFSQGLYEGLFSMIDW